MAKAELEKKKVRTLTTIYVVKTITISPTPQYPNVKNYHHHPPPHRLPCLSKNNGKSSVLLVMFNIIVVEMFSIGLFSLESNCIACCLDTRCLMNFFIAETPEKRKKQSKETERKNQRTKKSTVLDY